VSDDEPILDLPKEHESRFGDVIDLDGIRIARGLPKRSSQFCPHRNMTYCDEERRVWCKDCQRTLDGYDAFKGLVSVFGQMERSIRRKTEAADQAMKATIHRRATKAIDKAWSGREMAICCPHCRGGLLPEDFSDGVRAQCSREYEMARRGRAANPQKSAP
jgi:hypothetical protein